MPIGPFLRKIFGLGVKETEEELPRVLPGIGRALENEPMIWPKPKLGQPFPSPDFINPEEVAARQVIARSSTGVPLTSKEAEAKALLEANNKVNIMPSERTKLAEAGKEAAENAKQKNIISATGEDIEDTQIIKSPKSLDDTEVLPSPKQIESPEVLPSGEKTQISTGIPEKYRPVPSSVKPEEKIIEIKGRKLPLKTALALGLISYGVYDMLSKSDNQTPQNLNKPLPNKVQEEIKKQESPNQEQQPVKQPEKAVKKALIDNKKEESVKPEEPKQQETLKEEPLKKELDFTGMTGASTEGLSEAQKGKDLAYYSALFGKVGSQLASSMAGATKQPDTSVFEDLMKHSDTIVQDYKDRVEMEKKDPNSAYSQGFRSFMGQLGYDVKGGSAEQIASVMPQAAKIYEMGEQAKARAIENQLKREAEEKNLKYKYDKLKEMSKIRAQENKEKLLEKKVEREKEQQNKFIERTSKQLEKHSDSLMKLQRAKASIDSAVKNPSSIKDIESFYAFISSLDPNSVVREGEIGLAKQANGMIGDLRLKASQLTTDPKLITEKSLRDMQDTINRLYDLSKNQYDLTTNAAYKRAKSWGISEDRFGEIDPLYERQEDKNVTSRQKKDKNITPEQLKAYANKYKLSEDQARSILNKGGFNVQ